MKPRKIKDQYGDTVTVSHSYGVVCVTTDQSSSGGDRHTVMDFSPEQSRALRKALKRAEQAA